MWSLREGQRYKYGRERKKQRERERGGHEEISPVSTNTLMMYIY